MYQCLAGLNFVEDAMLAHWEAQNVASSLVTASGGGGAGEGRGEEEAELQFWARRVTQSCLSRAGPDPDSPKAGAS